MEAALKQFAEQVQVKPEDLVQLDLDGQGIHELTDADMKALSKCQKLSHLSIGDNGLKKVSANFPALPHLSMLDLRGNELSSDVLSTLSRLPQLEVLMLTHNGIKTLDKFANLKGFSKLQYLGLEECPVTETHADYREKLFALIPTLQVIDFVDRDGNEIERPEAGEGDSEDEEEEEDLADFYNKEYSDSDDENDEEFNPEQEPDEDEEEEEEEEEEEPVAKKPKH